MGGRHSSLDLNAEIKSRIEAALPEATATVSGGGGHYEIEVTSPVFDGKRVLARQRLVYAAIKELMAGDAAPLHAIDRMVCNTP